MNKWVACGSVNNPKRAKEYICFYSKTDWQTEKEAQSEAKLWEEEKRYPFIWVEKRR